MDFITVPFQKNRPMFLIILATLSIQSVGFFIWRNNFLNKQATNIPSAIGEYENIEKLIESERGRGYQIRGGMGGPGLTTESERINNELLVINNNRLTELTKAVERFNAKSTILSQGMIILSIIMMNLVGFQLYLTFREKQKQSPSEPMRFTY